MYRAQPFTAGNARSAIFLASPYFADQYIMYMGLGYTERQIRAELNTVTEYMSRAFGGVPDGGQQGNRRSAALVLYRLEKYLDNATLRENARELVWRCGERGNQCFRVLDALYAPRSLIEIAKEVDMDPSTVNNNVSMMLRRTGSVSRLNLMVRASGLSREEWTRPMDTEGVSPWANLMLTR